jgi:hypothetical protein
MIFFRANKKNEISIAVPVNGEKIMKISYNDFASDLASVNDCFSCENFENQVFDMHILSKYLQLKIVSVHAEDN